jgi:SAM-dependent methyltransferase
MKRLTIIFLNITYRIVPLNVILQVRHKLLWKKSAMAHRYLDGLRGIEIGGSFTNSFGLKTLNVDYTEENNQFTQEDLGNSGQSLKVDIVANGDDLPFKDNVWDFVINSHVLEHFFDPIKTVNEWMRVIKPGGYLYMIVPHKERTFDHVREITSLSELFARHNNELKIQDYAYNATTGEHIAITDGPTQEGFERFSEDNHLHWNVWNTRSFLDFMKCLELDVVEYQDVDDKIGNGFAVVIKKGSK